MTCLLDFDFCATLLELFLHGVGFFFRDTSLDWLRRTLDQVLGFLQAEACELAHDLDDLNLFVGWGRRQNDVERRLFLCRRSGCATCCRRSCHSHWSGSSNTEACL